MKRVTRLLAVFMIFAILLGMMPQKAYAKEVSGNGLEPVTDLQETEDEKLLEDGEDEKTEEKTEEETFGEEGKLDFLYIESSYIESPGSQAVLVGFGDEDTRLLSGTLTVENYQTKEQHVYSSEETLENTVLFEIPFLEKDGGIYEVKSVSVTTEDGSQASFMIADTGMADVLFGVDREVPELEEGAMMPESADFDMSDVQLQVAALDGDGSRVSRMVADEIGEALANGDKGRMRAEDNGEIVVVIDPGHDAAHAGARANGLKEEALTLKIAQYCKAELEEYSGVRVYMTREGTGCPCPGTNSTDCNANRVALAARVGADYFVSIHLNSAPKAPSARGSEIYYPNANYNSSIGVDGANLARHISRQLGELGLNQRGLFIRNSENNTKYPDGSLADYYGVIRRSKEAGITAVIVEHAFLTNASDAAFLSNEGNLQRLGVADATGIANYLGLTKGPAVDRAQVEAYVTRLYRLCLGREPDLPGLEDWTDRMCSGSITGAETARGFFFSDEFQLMNHTNEEYVELLYNVMMNRGSDDSGKMDWVYKLNNGVGRMGVFKGFADSREFDDICTSYGIRRGTVVVNEGRDRNPGLTTFVSRLYTKALGRDYDIYGLNDWCNRICDKKWNIMDVSTTGFFESPEFLNKRLTNGEYVKVLYRTFFDREYDQEGYVYWLRKLNAGESRKEVLRGFADSQEFAQLMKSYGL